ncbi:MAG: MFS transporter [Candidatus Bathyarchaeota archaeon]|nr:MFS transporter [Candidatus Bathyarchaeota archaeon]MCX8177244.1 MFS transporter [Candidatus Bathyarchaeota archaeon]MDW8193513.1 MFS transporter [Nitrososphaerota archaeon]
MLKSRKSLALIITLSTLYSLGVGLLGPIYPVFVVNRFSASYVDLGILYAIFCLMAAVFKAPAGKLADLYGKEKIFMLGVIMGAACSLSYVYVSSLIHLYALEFLFGISHALQRPSILAMMVDLSDNGKRGFILGMFESVYDLTEAAAALLSTLIVAQVGFEALFYICSGCQATTGIFMLKCRERTL